MPFSRFSPFVDRNRPAWGVLLLCLGLTAAVWGILRLQAHTEAQNHFDWLADQWVDAVQSRLQVHEQILLGAAGLFDASVAVDRAEWRAYVSRLQLNRNYPGILGVGFARYLRADQLASQEQAIHNEGFAGYAVKPPGARAQYAAVELIEPFAGRNLAAFGYDMLSEQTRAVALLRAAETGNTAMSGKVTLVQEINGKVQAGFLINVPVYRQGVPLNTSAERWAALTGFVYSPYRMGDLMHETMAEFANQLGFEVYDGSSESGEALMYASDDFLALHHASEKSRFHEIRSIEAFGHRWRVRLHSHAGSNGHQNVLLEGGFVSLGVLISGLLFFLVRLYRYRRDEAEGRADTVLQRQHELLQVMNRVQSGFILDKDIAAVFNELLSDLLTLTGSEYGFMGEIHHDADQQPFLKTHAITNIAWNDATRRFYDENIGKGLEFRNLKTLFGAAITSGKPVIANHPATDARRGGLPEGHPRMDCFLGAPINLGGKMLGLLGLSNRSGGYDQALIDYLQPLLATIAHMIQALGLDRDRKQAQQTLEENARHAHAVLDNIIDGIITVDERGLVKSFNPAAERMFAWSQAQVVGQHFSLLLPEYNRKNNEDYWVSDVASPDRRVFGVGREIEGLRSNGEVFAMELSISEISGDGLRQFVGVARDITERKRNEKMKSEFVSTVSHELRTPLTSINGVLGLLRGGVFGELPAPVNAQLDIAQRNGIRLSSLINDLLDMEKIAAGKLELDLQVQALPPLLEQAVMGNSGYAEKCGVSFRLVDVASAWVRVDAFRFRQVMDNLLSNAAKFSPPGGDVVVSAQVLGNTTRLSVTDKGCGIPEAYRQRVFEKFSQADGSDTRQKGGTGLGLAISRELVERMGGTIGFTSVEKEGTTFWCDFPSVPAPVDVQNIDNHGGTPRE